MSTVVVLISGFRGAGKDTAARYLDERFDFKRLAFADVLKDHVANSYEIPRMMFDDRHLKETPLLQYPIVSADRFSEQVHMMMENEHSTCNGRLYHTPRSLCILEGSIKRSVDANYWVRQVAKEVREGGKYCISDWRYRSEVAGLKSLLPNAKIITLRIDRQANISSTDPSERDLEGYTFDTRVSNVGSMGELYLELDHLAEVTLNFDATTNPDPTKIVEEATCA